MWMFVKHVKRDTPQQNQNLSDVFFCKKRSREINSFFDDRPRLLHLTNLKHERWLWQHTKAQDYMLISGFFSLFVCLFFFNPKYLTVPWVHLLLLWGGFLCALMRPKTLTVKEWVPCLNCCFMPYIFYSLMMEQHYAFKCIVTFMNHFHVWPQIWQFLILKCTLTITAAAVSPSSFLCRPVRTV